MDLVTSNLDVRHVDVIFWDLKMKFATQTLANVRVNVLWWENFVIVAFKIIMVSKAVKVVLVSIAKNFLIMFHVS